MNFRTIENRYIGPRYKCEFSYQLKSFASSHFPASILTYIHSFPKDRPRGQNCNGVIKNRKFLEIQVRSHLYGIMAT